MSASTTTESTTRLFAEVQAEADRAFATLGSLELPKGLREEIRQQLSSGNQKVMQNGLNRIAGVLRRRSGKGQQPDGGKAKATPRERADAVRIELRRLGVNPNLRYVLIKDVADGGDIGDALEICREAAEALRTIARGNYAPEVCTRLRAALQGSTMVLLREGLELFLAEEQVVVLAEVQEVLKALHSLWFPRDVFPAIMTLLRSPSMEDKKQGLALYYEYLPQTIPKVKQVKTTNTEAEAQVEEPSQVGLRPFVAAGPKIPPRPAGNRSRSRRGNGYGGRNRDRRRR